MKKLIFALAISLPFSVSAQRPWADGSATDFGTSSNPTFRLGPAAIGYNFQPNNDPNTGKDPSNLAMFLVRPQRIASQSNGPNNNIGHIESGSFGDVFGGAKWIGIGSTPSNVAIAGYGARFQWNNSVAIFTLRERSQGDPIKDAVLQWGSNDNDFLLEYANSPFQKTEVLRANRFKQVGINANPAGSPQFLVVGGSILANSFDVASDSRLKTNIQDLNKSNILEKINTLQPKSYYYDKNNKVTNLNLPSNLQYGFLAQDLERTFPTLVTTAEGGSQMKSVNYMGMIPLLVEAMQELDKKYQARINDLEAQISLLNKTSNDKASGCEIYQNYPNPFTESTFIKYKINPSVKSASILVFDMQGKTVATFDKLQNKASSIEIKGSSLPSGMYMYTLLVDGKEVATKRMILTK